MANANADRNLLFGILALQMDFIGRDTLIAAMSAWVLDKAKPLGQILLDQQALNPDEYAVLEALVQKHLQRHGEDTRQSLAALAVPHGVRQELESVADGEVHASLAAVADPEATTAYRPAPAADGIRYQILRPHAQGALGAVFLALDQELHREVALKEMRPHCSADAASRNRFVQEAEITGGLEHPGIVPVYGLGQYPDGRPYYAMRFIQGETLKDAIRKFHAGAPGVTLRGLLTRFVAVCNAVAYAHSRGVLHRDLKPANVMLGKYGETLVVDWGLAKAVGRARGVEPDSYSDEATLQPHSSDSGVATQTGFALGTPVYMSPEQAAGRLDLLGPATDVYSLGATLYTLLTGQSPIAGGETAAVLDKVRRGDWRPPRQLKKETPTALDVVCRKAMALQPQDRYATALALAADVEAWLADEPVRAWREPWPVRARRWLGRHRTLVTAAAAVVVVAALALATGVVLLTAANERERDARRTAELKEEEARQQRDEGRWNLYVSNMNLAQREWEKGNVAQVLELLEECAPKQAGDKDLRGWEWYYQRRLCHGDLRTLKGHTGPVHSVAFSPDGTGLASAGEDGSVRLWDAVGGKEVRVLKRHAGWAVGLAYRPDGTRLAAGGSDGIVRIWDTADGREVGALKGHAGWVVSVAYRPDGARLASAGQDGTVRVWDADSGKELLVLKGDTDWVRSVVYSPDGTRLASAGSDGVVRIWDAAAGLELRALLGHTHSVHNLAFSPDGARLASAGADGTLRVWDPATGAEVRRIRGHAHWVRSVAYSPDGTRLTSGDMDGAMRVWDAVSGGEVRLLKGHASGVLSLTYSPDGTRLASAGSDGVVRVWDAVGGAEARVLRGHTAMVAAVAYSPNGARLASAGVDRIVRLWDTAGGEVCVLKGHVGEASCVAFSPEGTRLAAGGSDGTIQVWDAAEGRESLGFKGHAGGTWCLAYSPDGSRLASAGADEMVRIWDTTGGREVRAFKGHTGWVMGVAYHRDGVHVASVGADGTVRVWDTTGGREFLVLQGHASWLHSVAYSPDGSRLAAGGSDGTIRVWDAADGKELLVLNGHGGWVASVAYSPDGSRLASAGHGRAVVWDAARGAELFVLTGDTGWGSCVAYSPDAWRLAAGGSDGTVRIADARPWTPHRQAEEEVLSLVEGLFARPLLKAEVIDRLCGHKTITEAVRRQALELAARYRDDPGRFHQASRNVVRYHDATTALYRKALGWAEVACRLAPENGTYLTTVGIAQYRLGGYADALTTLSRSDQLNRGSQPADLAFLAMAHHRLGHKEKAKSALERLREAMKKPPASSEDETLAFLAEAEALLQAQPKNPKK